MPFVVICNRFKLDNKNEEIVDLSKGRQSISSQLIHEPRYLLIFKGKQGEDEGVIKFKMLHRNRREDAIAKKGLENLLSKLPDFLNSFAGYEYTGTKTPTHPLREKLNAVQGFSHINFQEVDNYLRFALNDGKLVYLEVPRILRKAKQFITDIEQFLKKPGAKLQLVYGVSDDYQHDIDTITKLKGLRKEYPNFDLIDLPERAYILKLPVTGVHKRVIIKDDDFYIETTYNFFTLDTSRKEKISAETATIFNKDVNEYYWKQIKTYKL
jgi:hypothetical protein